MKAFVFAALSLAAFVSASSVAAQPLTPAASGTIRNLPELGILDVAPVGDLARPHTSGRLTSIVSFGAGSRSSASRPAPS